MYKDARSHEHKFCLDLCVPKTSRPANMAALLISCNWVYNAGVLNSLARPGRKQATATEDFDVHIFFSWRYNPSGCIFHSPVAGFSLLIRGFLITHKDAPQSVGLLWTSDQSVAETSTWQHTTLTTDKHPCPRWDSNPQSQRTSGRAAVDLRLRRRGHLDRLLMFIYPIYNHNWRNISTVYIYNKTSIKRNILTVKQNTSGIIILFEENEFVNLRNVRRAY